MAEESIANLAAAPLRKIVEVVRVPQGRFGSPDAFRETLECGHSVRAQDSSGRRRRCQGCAATMSKPAEWQWLTTSSSPRRPATGHDAGQRGWRLHAVRANAEDTFSQVRGRRAACGLLARHGWGLDQFIDEKCSKCVAAIQREAKP
jgi:hypothetical protein